MKFNPGDKVAFINEKQNGIVIKNLSGNKVIVEIEDGFEIEVLEKELVKTGESLVEIETIEEPAIQIPDSKKSSSLIELCSTDSICFAGVPAATGAVLTGMVNYYLINNSEFDMVFTLHIRKQKRWEGISRDVLQKSNSALLTTFKREDLTDVELFLIEGLLFGTEQRPSVNHIRKEMGILLPDISQTHPGHTGVTAFAKVIELFNGKEPEPEQFDELKRKMGTKAEDKSGSKKSVFLDQSHSNKYGVLINEKVIDLHIEELINDFSGLSNFEMLEMQLKQFTKEMDNAIRNNFKRIVFIHGVGNGVLKREIRNELLSYHVASINDGDFSKYGYGATEVVF